MSKSCCCSVLGLCVKSSTSSSEVEGWVRMIRGICHIIESEGWGIKEGRQENHVKECAAYRLREVYFLNLFLFLISYSSTVREEVTYSHCMFSILQRVFFQFRQDPIPLIRPFRLRHKEKNHNVWKLRVMYGEKRSFFSKLPTVSLPLQTTASMLLDKQPSVLSINAALAAWPVWFDSCCPVTPRSSRGPSGSGTSRGGSLSLRTVIQMQLPAFLRALTASWWVAPCMSRPLTWKERRAHGHIRHVVPLKLWEQRSEVRELHVFPENSMTFLCKTDFTRKVLA